MYYVKNFKDQGETTQVNKITTYKIKNNKSNREKKILNPNPSLIDVNLKYFKQGLNLPMQFEKVDIKKQMNATGKGFFDCKAKLEEKELPLPNLIGNVLSTRNIHSSYSDIRKIAYDYERKLHTSHDSRKREIESIKEIKEKSFKSDIFFQNTQEKVKGLNINALLKRNSSESNIFFLQNKGLKDDRSSEKYFYHPKQKIYATTKNSNSEWCPNTQNRSILNYSNTDYSLFNPGVKNLSKTRDSINKESKVNPIFKQKSISESLDIFGNTCFNPNKNFVEIAKRHPNAFFQNSEVCATFLDLHKNYGGLFPKPFVKKIV